MAAIEKTIRPVFFPLFFFSLIAENNDNDMRIKAITRNNLLCSGSHFPSVALPSPKLARISETCQQNANIAADMTAPILLKILFIIFLQ